jgi:hypothetical protein
MKMIGETREDWLCFLHGDDSRTFLVLVSEEEARGAYALYREGRVLEAARALDEAVAVAYEVPEELWDDLVDTVPDMAWRAKGFPLGKEQVIDERPGEAVILLRGEPYEAKKMPVGVISGIGWDRWEPEKFHYTLVLDEELLATEPLEGLPKREESPE